MKLYDTHVHLDLLAQKCNLIPFDVHEISVKPISEVQKVLQTVDIDAIKTQISSYLTGHEFVIQSTTHTSNAYLCDRLFSGIDGYHMLLGSHPDIVTGDFDVDRYLTEQASFLQENLKIIQSIVGIGEVGLDYYREPSIEQIKKQKELCIAQITLANIHNLPLVFHVRDAFDDFFEILDAHPPLKPFVVHCFTGFLPDAKQILKRGGYLGIGGVCTFKNAGYLADVVTQVPIESIVLETDLPYLSPTPMRGKVCMPQYIHHTAEFIAENYGKTVEEVLHTTKQTSTKIFKI